MLNQQEMINIYKHYGFDMPLKAKYKRINNRIYFNGDFKDGEEIEFFWCSDKPNTCALGNAFYKNKNGTSNLINISELDII
jgi:hypothetical protein